MKSVKRSAGSRQRSGPPLPWRQPDGTSFNSKRGEDGFTLLELLVVIGLIAALSLFLAGGLRGGGKATALRSGQALLANFIMVARSKALATGQSSRVLVHVDVASALQPSRYLRCVAVQTQATGGWETFVDTFLPEGIYIVPGNFADIPAGLFASDTTVPWTKMDGSALRSTALRANAITVETIDGSTAEQWVGITISATGGTVQSGDLIVTVGKNRPPGSYSTGESPVELENPEDVRGLTLSSYAVPTLINGRNSF